MYLIPQFDIATLVVVFAILNIAAFIFNAWYAGGEESSVHKSGKTLLAVFLVIGVAAIFVMLKDEPAASALKQLKIASLFVAMLGLGLQVFFFMEELHHQRLLKLRR